LIHFVATFDEGRHLLLWDPGALTNAFYLAFGTDPNEARNADKLQHDMERESSRGRNVRFAARHLTERIDELRSLVGTNHVKDSRTEEELLAQHEALLESGTRSEERVRRKQAELREADLKWTDLSSSLTESQIRYRKLFSSRLRLSSSVEHHPVIRASISEDRCAVCGTQHIGSKIQAQLDAGKCPLCESPIHSEQTDSKTVDELRDIDINMNRMRTDLEEVIQSRERIYNELRAAQASEDAATAALRQFEEEHTDVRLLNRTGEFSAVEKEIEKLESERELFLEQSSEHYRQRDVLRDKLRKLEKKLTDLYEKGAEKFLPRFRELSEEFIGLPVDVTLQHRKGANDSGFGLLLKLDDQLRPDPESVSESQRFFLDIALRMALSEFMATGPATLLIDTPEGSLDIAYEARAGIMLSRFASSGNALLMTANLRSSALIIRLAELRKRAGMQIVKMTEWTDLSQVQLAEEHLFTEAYKAIETALAAK
jgi:predicted RNA-binding Zn ribbon-like protein